MADKTINELTAATTMGNDDLLVLQQGGTAKKLSGKQLGDYVYNAAAEKVAEVNKAVDDAKESINDIVESVQSMTELGTDTTLSTSGMAADAKVAGDKIKAVETAAMADLSQGTASGSIVIITDGAENVPIKKITVNIEPVQAGSGDSSPENVRPITGWTGMHVEKTGKNLFNGDIELGGIGGYGGSSGSSTRCRTAGHFLVKGGETYYASVESGKKIMAIHFYEEPNDESWIMRYANSLRSCSFTVPANANYIRITFANEDTGTPIMPDDIEQFMLEIGSEESDYEPYTGETYSITFPSEAGTVYGGKLEINEDGSGVLTVGEKLFTINQSDVQSTAQAGTGNGRRIYLNSSKYQISSLYPANAVCNYYKVVDSYSKSISTDMAIGLNNIEGTQVIINDSSIDWSTDDQFFGRLQNTPLQVSYPIPTPLSYTLTAYQITTLLGTNHIWADTGDITEFVYRKAPVDSSDIDEKIAEIEPIIAGRETTMTATKNYSSGSLVIVDHILYRLDTNVASGETFASGTNCHMTTVEAEIAEHVPNYRTVNGQDLTSDITLSAEDIPYDDSLSEHTSGSVGEAVSGLKESIEVREEIKFTNGYFYNCRASSMPANPSASATMRTAKIACTVGDMFLLNAKTTNATTRGVFAFWDASGNNLYNSISNISIDNKWIIAPARAAWLIINDVYLDTKCYKGQNTKEAINNVKTDLHKTTGGELIPFSDGLYVNLNNTPSVGQYQSSENYRVASIEVSQGDKFTLNCGAGTSVGTYAFVDSSLNVLEKNSSGSTLANTVITAPANAAYLYINDNVKTGECYRGVIASSQSVIDAVSAVDFLASSKPRYASSSGDIADGGSIVLSGDSQMSEKDERTVFSGNVTRFDKFYIGLTSSTDVVSEVNRFNCFEINDTNIAYKPQSTATAVTVAHGLTITNNIQIILEVKNDTADLTLISNGELFKHTFGYNNLGVRRSFVYSDGSVLTGCALSWTCKQLNKKIWFFGDSYLSYAENRWMYYLAEYGYRDNVLVNAYPGENGLGNYNGYCALLKFGKPKIAVWCVGMNDGSDTSSNPNELWTTYKDNFLGICNENGIIPILATIPTVPNINHEQKNAWVRASGYRYIDFAKAVGALGDGTWFSGMLSTDNVHPTAKGAKALFAQALVDLPEIMVSDFA